MYVCICVDFYSGHQVNSNRGVIAMHLDVRPALDRPSALFERIDFTYRQLFRPFWPSIFGFRPPAATTTATGTSTGTAASIRPQPQSSYIASNSSSASSAGSSKEEDCMKCGSNNAANNNMTCTK